MNSIHPRGIALYSIRYLLFVCGIFLAIQQPVFADDDFDGDGMPNQWEVDNGLYPYFDDSADDPDYDMLSNLGEFQNGTQPWNPDTDGDYLLDGEEVANGTNPLLADSDGDGMPNQWESDNGLDPYFDDSAGDPDYDMLSNLGEFQHGTQPWNPDTDGDYLLDGEEVANGTDPLTVNSDSDGMPDQWELDNGLNPYFDDSAEDPDYDMLSNLGEFQNGTQPFNWDTDGDWLSDGEEVANGTNPLSADSDGDGMPDFWETYNGLNPMDPEDASLDQDWDDLVALDEFNHNSNPQLFDTDGDGLGDGMEVAAGLNPDHADSDNDGIADAEEYNLGMNPAVRDSDADGVIDGFETGRIARASIPADGRRLSSYYESSGAALSADGRYLAFISDSGELVAGDNNGVNDIFVHDVLTGSTELISMAANGGAANNWSGRIVNSIGLDISADGRYVVFISQASNLVNPPVSGTQVYLRDRQTGTTELVSINSQGQPGTNNSYNPSISADTRYVAFESYAPNLVSGDTNNRSDIFVRDRQTGQVVRASVSSNGSQGNDYSNRPVISADGRFVAFESTASNLVPNDTNGSSASYLGKDVFVRDLQAGETSRVSVSSGGVQANKYSEAADISADGRYVVFSSIATNLVNNDTNNNGSDIFLHDRTTGTTTLVSVNQGGSAPANKGSAQPVISQDGRYVAFWSLASNLVPGDPAWKYTTDVYMRDLQTGLTSRLSVNNAGIVGNYDSGRYGIALSGDSRRIAFQSEAGNLVPGDASFSDIFVALTGVQ